MASRSEAPAGTAFDVFVSYAREDGEWVRALAERLHGEGLDVFFDEWEIGLGDVIVHRLDEGLRTTRNGILVVSPASMGSSWVAEEYAAMVTRAVAGGLRLIPVLHGDAEMPPMLATRRWLDFRRATGPAYQDLVRQLAAALRGERAGPPTAKRASPESAAPQPIEASDLWSRLSPACRAAFGWAVALRGAASQLAVTETLLLGMIRTQPDSEPEILLRHFGHDVTELVETVRDSYPSYELDASRPVDLRETPALSTNVREALRVAASITENASTAAEIQLQHLFEGLLSRPQSGAYRRLQAVLPEADMADVAASYADYRLRGPTASYADFLRERFLRERFPRPAAPDQPAQPFRRERAGYASDATAVEDWLGFQSDLVPLCEVIMAQDVSPPLSIGLFGEWGSGKSTFMRLMQAEIDRIARRAQEASGSREVAFCTDVRQIGFNAWHYADANLWASLVIHIFEQLGAPGGAGGDDERRQAAADERRRLVVKLETQQQLLAEATARRDTAESTRDIALGALAAVSRDEVASIAEDPQVQRAQERIKKDLGLRDVTPEKVEEVAGELAEPVVQVRNAWRLLTRGREVWPIVLPVAAAVIVGAAVYLLVRSGIAAWTVALTLGSIGTLTGFLAGPLATVRSIGATAARAVRSIESARERAERRKAELQRRVDEAEENVRAVQLEIDEIAEGRRLRRFIQDRSRSSDYLSHLGLVSLIRRDFEELSRLLEDNRRARREGRVLPHDLPGIERVILYIDDLDRCSDTQVVQVLEAVHLLLAFDIFVVVVGVDPRWLVRSLQRHHPGQLRAEHNGPGDVQAASPLDYLEKIFQIPFALRPMDRIGYQALVEKVLPVRSLPPTEPESPDVVGAGPPAPPSPSAAGELSRAEDSSPPREPERDLDPENLRVDDHELEFAQALWPIIATPRVAKRLINIYRLIRASLPETEFKALVRKDPVGDYQVVLLLLAVLVGFPSAAGELFDDLMTSSSDEDLWTRVEARQDRDDGLARALLAVRHASPGGLTTDRVRLWIPRVARHSFQALRLASE